MLVFINPGHAPNGVPDPGAVNKTLNKRECDIALDVSNRVAHYLRKVGIKVEVFQNDSLHQIVDTSNDFYSDLFLSIHCNAANGSARGSECFVSTNCSHYSEIIADKIQRQIVNSLGTIDRGVKYMNYYVLKYTDAPATLIELEFIDNDDACRLMLDKTDEFAKAIARGVTDYIMEVTY